VRLTGLANRAVAQPAEMGALPQLYGATAPGVAGGQYFGPDGWFEQHGHPKEVRGSSAAYKTAEAARLWELSEELTGVIYAWPEPPS
jgi:hypothetical protein